MIKTNMILSIANRFGNVEEGQIPKGYIHVPGKRLQPLCRKLGIKHASCLVGWAGSRRYPKPVLDGVVISAKSEEKLRQAIAAREARAKPPKTPEEKAAAKRRRQEQDVSRFAARILDQFPACPPDEAQTIAAHACQIGSGRVGRSRTAANPIHAAVVAHIRHTYTDYDDLMTEGYIDEFERDQIRDQIRPQIAAKLDEWQCHNFIERLPGGPLNQSDFPRIQDYQIGKERRCSTEN